MLIMAEFPDFSLQLFDDSKFQMESLARFPEIDEFLVSKETVVLRRWERSNQKLGFIKRVDKG